MQGQSIICVLLDLVLFLPWSEKGAYGDGGAIGEFGVHPTTIGAWKREMAKRAGEVFLRSQRSTIAARARGCEPFEDDGGAGMVACGQRRTHRLAEIVSAPREAAE